MNEPMTSGRTITFERAFASYRMNSSFFVLREGDARDHNCGWLVRPRAADLMGGYRIWICWGCGSTFRDEGTQESEAT